MKFILRLNQQEEKIQADKGKAQAWMARWETMANTQVILNRIEQPDVRFAATKNSQIPGTIDMGMAFQVSDGKRPSQTGEQQKS